MQKKHGNVYSFAFKGARAERETVMNKHIGLWVKRLLAVTLSLCMALSLPSLPARAEGSHDDLRVVIAMEGLTLGQGLYTEPKEYTLTEINSILSSNGFETFTEDTLTAAAATVAMLIDQGLEFEYSGGLDSFYLQKVKGIDKGYVDVPEVILDNGGDADEGNADEWLGEFDYNFMAGWMITVNDLMIPVGAGQYGLGDSQYYEEPYNAAPYDNTTVIRWQFTLFGYGADLGFDAGWGMPVYFDHANKDKLYIAYANSSDLAAKEKALKVLENLTATEEEVEEALALFEKQEAPVTPAPRDSQDVRSYLNSALTSMAATVTAPTFGTGAGEWSVLSLARGGYYNAGDKYFEDYYARIEETVKSTAASVNLNGALHKNKSTENSRLIMALSSIGKSARNVAGVDLVGAYDKNGFNWIKKQGINGPVFMLIALDTAGYKLEDETIRQQCIDYILGLELENGGWALSGKTADPDMTAMTLQALVNYKNQEAVAKAAERGFKVLSDMQTAEGGYASWGSVNSESIAQVIVACTAWGINPDTDPLFVKNGKSAVDALLSFYTVSDTYGSGFKHVASGDWNSMATDQGTYALVAYNRLLKGQPSLYDMSDVEIKDTTTVAITVTSPDKVENLKGTKFNASINLTGWDSNAGYKLMDCIVSIPKELSVTEVKMGEAVSGGQLSCNLEEETGKLRIVYFDPEKENDIVVSATSFPVDFVTIGLEVKDNIDIKELPEAVISVLGMSLKTDAENMYVVDVERATTKSKYVTGITFTVLPIATGDDVDVFASSQTILVIAVTGVEKAQKIVFTADGKETSLGYSEEISAKTGVETYICMKGEKSLEDYASRDSYRIEEGKTADKTIIGDVNGDGVINAQDALKIVDLWLRKTPATSDAQIITSNVNADSRINTFDALGIVEYYVKGRLFEFITKAATIKEAING